MKTFNKSWLHQISTKNIIIYDSAQCTHDIDKNDNSIFPFSFCFSLRQTRWRKRRRKKVLNGYIYFHAAANYWSPRVNKCKYFCRLGAIIFPTRVIHSIPSRKILSLSKQEKILFKILDINSFKREIFLFLLLCLSRSQENTKRERKNIHFTICKSLKVNIIHNLNNFLNKLLIIKTIEI